MKNLIKIWKIGNIFANCPLSLYKIPPLFIDFLLFPFPKYAPEYSANAIFFRVAWSQKLEPLEPEAVIYARRCSRRMSYTDIYVYRQRNVPRISPGVGGPGGGGCIPLS